MKHRLCNIGAFAGCLAIAVVCNAASPATTRGTSATEDDARVAETFLTSDSVAIVRLDVDADWESSVGWLKKSLRSQGATEQQVNAPVKRQRRGDS